MSAKQKQPENWEKRSSLWMLLIMVLASLYLIIQSLHVKSIQKPVAGQSNSSSVWVNDRINEHYRTLYFRKMRQELEIDNERTRSQAKKDLPLIQTPSQTNMPADYWPPINSPQEQTNWFSTERTHTEFDLLTPEDRVHYELRQKQEEQLENERLREEFIRRFKENARRDGIEIRIDKNLRAYPARTARQ